MLIGALQAGADALRRFIRELDRHLQQSDGELVVDLRGHPQTKSVVDVLCLDECIHCLIAERKGEMDVLQQDPPAACHRIGD